MYWWLNKKCEKLLYILQIISTTLLKVKYLITLIKIVGGVVK